MSENNPLDSKGLKYGESREYAYQKLRDDAPELHKQVLSGEISAHAAKRGKVGRPPKVKGQTDARGNVSEDSITDNISNISKQHYGTSAAYAYQAL